MLLIHLNLLSPAKKNRLKTMVRFLFTKEILEVIIFTAAILGVMYLLSWLILASTLRELTTGAFIINRRVTAQNREVKMINHTMQEVVASAKLFYPLSPHLIELLTTLPPDIKLTALVFNRADQTLALAGVAKTREALITYEKIIGSLPWLEKKPSPASQLLQRANVSFEFSARLTTIPAIKLEKTASKTPTQ